MGRISFCLMLVFVVLVWAGLGEQGWVSTFTRINMVGKLCSGAQALPADPSLVSPFPYKARMIRTLIWAVMSSLLYLLSYSLKVCGQRVCTSIYWSWASHVTITLIRVNNVKYLNSPVRELHSYLPITKRVHYYYANQAK